MEDPADANAAVWQSAESVQAWAAEAERQERSRGDHRRFMAVLLPFAEQDEFTFLDLGAGTGAASRAILDLHPRSTAILADFSAEMMRAGEREMGRFAGRHRYLAFAMAAGRAAPPAVPPAPPAAGSAIVGHPPPAQPQPGPVAP